MKISEQGIKLLIAREGAKTKAYKDTKGIWTIGVGHTSAAGLPNVYAGQEITVAQVSEILHRDLKAFEDVINEAVKVPLEQHEFDALVSFTFNIGGTGFKRSKTLKLLNAGQKKEAGDAMMGWVTPPEITGRRRSEVKQYHTGYNRTEKPVGEVKVPPATTTPPAPKSAPTGLLAKIGAFLTAMGLGIITFAESHPFLVIGAAVLALGGTYLVLKHFSKE